MNKPLTTQGEKGVTYYFCKGNLELEQMFLETILEIDSGVLQKVDRTNRNEVFTFHQTLLGIVPFITKA